MQLHLIRVQVDSNEPENWGEQEMTRQRAITGWVAAFVCVLGVAACDEGGTPPPVASDVAVSPATIEVTEGDEVQAQATVRDDNGNAIPGATVEWSSDDESIATVDGSGMVAGVTAGATVVRATYNGIAGTADVTVDAAAEFTVSQRTVTIPGYVGSEHAPIVLDIGGPDADSITGLGVQVTYESEAVDWITTELGGTSVPSTLTLGVSTEGLQAGVYAGSVLLASDTPEEGQREIDVTLTLAGLAIAQTDEATAVAETGTTDSVSVALALQPDTSVVLTVTSSDAGEATADPATLTFTAENWSTPQWVTVTGVDDDEIDGQQVSVMTIAVDTAQSDPLYDALPVQTVEVTTADNEAGGLSVTETDGGTVVAESGSTDELRVSLVSQPAADVVLTVTSSDEGEVTVSPATLTFTAADWSTVQAVTVTGVDDGDPDGDQTSNVTIAVDAGLSDDAWDAVAAVAIDVTTVDDDAGSGVSESAPAGHPGVSTDQLVAAYDMSSLTPAGLLRDFSGNDLHGTITGTTPVAGVRGGARYFPGTITDGRVADYIELPPQPVFDLDGPLTVAAWFYFDRQFQHQHIIACDDKFALWITEQDHMRFANTRADYAEMTVRVSPNQFHSVVAIFRGTAGDVIDDSTVEIWIDGVRQQPLEFGSQVNDPPIWRDGTLWPTDACYIGFESHQGREDHVDLPYYGAIDEVIVFGRALTPEEVALLALTQD